LRFLLGRRVPAFVSLHRLIDEKSSLALRPLFSGKKIPVEWMFIALWNRNCDRPGDLASTALSALSGRRTDAGSGTAS